MERTPLYYIAVAATLCMGMWWAVYAFSGSRSGLTVATSTTLTTVPAVTSASSSHAVRFEIVTDAAAEEKGLSGRSSIPSNYAMLFVFPTAGRYGFWMKDMLVPIDIVWVTDKGVVAKVDEGVLPDTYPAVLYPPVPVRYVLETRAGESKALGWAVGTTVELPEGY